MESHRYQSIAGSNLEYNIMQQICCFKILFYRMSLQFQDSKHLISMQMMDNCLRFMSFDIWNE